MAELAQESKLSEAWANLTLANNVPDYRARRANLIALVDGDNLNHNEIRLLKSLLGSMTLQNDFIPKLPIELVLEITDYLDEEDISTALAISSQWRSVFTGHRVLLRLAIRFFPWIAWNYTNHTKEPGTADDGDDDDDVEVFKSSFVTALRHRLVLRHRASPLFRHQFLWADEDHFVLSEQDYSEYPTPELGQHHDMKYAHRQIAWQPENHTVVLDDLLHRSRRLYSVPGGKLLGPRLTLAALGDQLIVATMGRRIFAWDHRSGRFEKTAVPTFVGLCTTVGDLVAAAAVIPGEIFIWKFGGPVRSISLPTDRPDQPSISSSPQAFLHPHLAHVVFVRLVHKSPSGSPIFTIYKFSHDNLERTFVYPINKFGRNLSSWDDGSRKLDDNGGYSPWDYTVRDNYGKYSPGRIPLACRHGARYLSVVEFDMYCDGLMEERDLFRLNLKIPQGFAADDDLVVAFYDTGYEVM
ncbi:hypothetical protein BX600DRAFT_450977 [Xylariales sp. PMI_506]|nr:hypothetical protein BX600DRAFT_450977 [Xylariales sp. PMI_506]